LLKLAELHRRLTPKGAVLGRHQGRVHSPAPDGRRRRRSCEPLGRDAVPRRELSEIRGALGNPSSTAELRAELRAIRDPRHANLIAELTSEPRGIRGALDTANPTAELTFELRGIRGALDTANPTAELTNELRQLREVVLHAVRRTSAEAASSSSSSSSSSTRRSARGRADELIELLEEPYPWLNRGGRRSVRAAVSCDFASFTC
jgi:hypothetical protein